VPTIGKRSKAGRARDGEVTNRGLVHRRR
jgi:hypothetical protein